MNPGFTLRHVVLIALFCLLTSCATQRQVEDIVARSNAALLAGATGDLFDAPPGGDGALGAAATNAGWRVVVAQIEEFASVHTNEPATVAPLRIRQAMVLLQHGQVRRADDAFSQAALPNLHSSRDKALRLLSTNLVWWFRAAPGRFDEDDLASAGQAVTNLSTRIATLLAPADESVRDYLAVTRAWISLKLARDHPDPTRAQQRFHVADAFHRYGALLTTNELQALAVPPPPSQRTRLELSDYRVAWGEALLAYATNQFRNRVAFQDLTNAFRARLPVGQ